MTPDVRGNNMKRIRQSFVIVVLFCFFGCASDRHVTFSSLESHDAVFYRKGQKEPFTGTVYHVQECERGNREEYPIFKGRIQGPLLVWNADGNILASTDYVNGEIHGYYRRWGTNGLVDWQMEFRNGQAHGVEQRWWENGQLMYSNSYNNGQKSQPTIYWDESGGRITEAELHMIRVHQSRKSREPKPDGDGLKPAP